MIRGVVGAIAVCVLVTGGSRIVVTAEPQARRWRASAANGTASSTDARSQVDAASARTTLNQYCVTCHNERLKTGGFVLDSAATAQIGQHPEVWEKVVQKLRAGIMP